MADKKWTKARVLKAYSEWKALQERAEEVLAAECSITGADDESFWRLDPPTWSGTNWPGQEVYWYSWDDCGEHDRHFPLERLWDDKWRVALKAKHDAWRTTVEGETKEREEREQYEKLKAKFGND